MGSFSTRADILGWDCLSQQISFILPPCLLISVGLGVALSPDGRCFVADSESGVQVIDVSDPGTPSLIGTITTSGYVSDVKLSPDGSVAFIADGHGLEIMDVSNPLDPVLMSTFDVPTDTTDVTLSTDGTTAFVASDSGVQVVDISNPSDPSLLSTLDINSPLSVTLSSDGLLLSYKF